MSIPFHKPLYDENEERALVESLRNGRLVGDGPSTARASEKLAVLLGVPHVLLTTSCTHALELAMMVLRLSQGDEVLVPSFTFVSTTNCVMRQGGRVVFTDITPDTLTMDMRDVERRITPRTKAVIPVVYAGVTPDLDTLRDLALKHSLIIVEDAAQGIAASYRNRPAGTLGDIGCYSFHETKNFSTGEGGAFVTAHDEIALRAEIIREKGTNRKQFLQGLVDKYTWVDVGSSYLPPDSTGALLLAQLEKMEYIQSRREAIHHRYVDALQVLERKELLTLPTIPRDVRSNYHIFYILMRDEATRNRALAFFHRKNIGATFHYLPLHLSPVGRTLGYSPGDYPITESVSGRLLRLPIYPSLSIVEQDTVIAALEEFFLS